MGQKGKQSHQDKMMDKSKKSKESEDNVAT